MKIYEDLPAEISHPAHPAHNLKLETPGGGAPFLCNGCKEPGEGPRYTCHCGRHSFDLHTCCALAERTLVHPLFGSNRAFKFLPEPTEPVEDTVCDACGEPVRGFVYHCFERDLDLHPCCATLQARITLDGHSFELRNEAARRCGVCGENRRRGKFWAYRSYYDGRSVYLHVACLKETARRSWDEAYQNRVGGGGCIVQASVPIMEGMLQNLSRNTGKSSGLDRFIKIVGTITNIVIAVIFGNPMAMIAAVVGPSGFLRG